MNRSWMDHRVVDGMISAEYKEGVKYFCDDTFENAALLVEGWIYCPYKRCVDRKILDRNTIIIHLYRSRFMSNYKYWYLQRETWEIIVWIKSQ